MENKVEIDLSQYDCWSVDEEHYEDGGVSEAADHIVCNLDPNTELPIVEDVWLGKARRHKASDFITSSDWLLDDMRDRAYDESGEYSEAWLDGIKKEDVDTLEKALKELIDKWADQTNNHPDFFTIEPDPKAVRVSITKSGDEYGFEVVGEKVKSHEGD